MKKVVLTFGLISGIIIGGMLFITMPMLKNGILDNGAVVGYSTMFLVGASTTFVAIKSYRDKYSGGVIKFGRAFLIGLYISLISSAMYALGWEIFLASQGMTGNEFMNLIMQKDIAKMTAAGASPQEINDMRAAMTAFTSWYDIVPLRFLWTALGESLPVGLLVSLINALILMRKTPKTA